MKKYIMLGLVFALVPIVSVKADITCEIGQVIQSVEISPAIDAVPAITHTETIIDIPAYDETDPITGDITHFDAITHDEIVIDTPAIDTIPAVYEDQCVIDSTYIVPIVENPAVVIVAPQTRSLGGHRHQIEAPQSPEMRLIDLCNQVIALLKQLQAMQ
jgi:hypothetical protein